MTHTALSLDAETIADTAVAALHAEADLTPKPGLVDRRGAGAHADMNVALLHRSADALRDAFLECCWAALVLDGTALRLELGLIGRAGERAMLAATGGVNTHRGALWALGLLSAGVAARGIGGACAFAAETARIPDPAADVTRSHGATARRRYGATGAAGEAAAGFPHVREHALPALCAARLRGADEATARVDALRAWLATVDDTCLLYRGGPAGLRAVQTAAADVLAEGGYGSVRGRARFDALDALCRTRILPRAAAATCWRRRSSSTCSRKDADLVQTLTYQFSASAPTTRAEHVGVVGSGDLEILLQPPGDGDPADRADVRVRTSVTGFDTVWREVLERFFSRTALAGRWELNDFGATPGVVNLRLRQAAEAASDGGQS